MRQTQIFSGSSHPALVDAVCERLGQTPAKAELGKFSNGETKVNLHTSIRDQDVFIVQSGSNKVNDSVMELLVMISACKSGSARLVTAVLPYFPYSRSSKQKSHRGAISARMIANLLNVAGVNHIITIDLHASQMQGFFQCPVDNLVAEPILANWIKHNIPDWRRAVVVSKNPGGTKRVTSLADALKLDFGIIMTDRRRPGSGEVSMNTSMILDRPAPHLTNGAGEDPAEDSDTGGKDSPRLNGPRTPSRRLINESNRPSISPLQRSTPPTPRSASSQVSRTNTAPSTTRDPYDESTDEEYDIDPRSRDVVTGRLVHGHIVDQDAPFLSHSSPHLQSHPHTPHADDRQDPTEDPMTLSFYSTTSSLHHHQPPTEPLGGSADAIASSDDEEEKLLDPALESTVTLVGNVRDRPVLIVDDMIDKSASWIVAAETCIKRGGATAVWCMATHGIFDGGRTLQEMEDCDCIEGVVVTNSYPIVVNHALTSASSSSSQHQHHHHHHHPQQHSHGGGSGGGGTQGGGELIDGLKLKRYGKLTVLDVSWLLSEAIRRNHHGESISQLFMHHEQ